jgi:hypothetical protein
MWAPALLVLCLAVALGLLERQLQWTLPVHRPQAVEPPEQAPIAPMAACDLSRPPMDDYMNDTQEGKQSGY